MAKIFKRAHKTHRSIDYPDEKREREDQFYAKWRVHVVTNVKYRCLMNHRCLFIKLHYVILSMDLLKNCMKLGYYSDIYFAIIFENSTLPLIEILLFSNSLKVEKKKLVFQASQTFISLVV